MNTERTKNKIKICYISHTYVNYERRNILREHAKEVDVSLIIPTIINSPYQKTEKAEAKNEDNIKVFSLKIGRLKKSNTTYFLSNLFRKLKEIKPDIIQVENELHSLIVIQVVLYKLLFDSKIKLVVFSWQNVRYNNSKQKIIDKVNDFIKNKINHFVSGNNDNKLMLQAIGVDKNKITVLPQYGVDPEYFYPLTDSVKDEIRQQLQIKKEQFIIGYCGRLIPAKGISDLVKAFRIVKEKYPHVVLLIIGDGELRKEIPADPDIIIQVCQYKDAGKYIGIMDLLILPSHTTDRWKEQFGHVLIEAMACGVIPLGSNSGAIPEVIGNQENIFLEKNHIDLSEKIKSFLEKKDLSVLKQLNIERAESVFFDSVVSQKYINIYNKLYYK